MRASTKRNVRVWQYRARAAAWAIVGVLSFVFGWANSVLLVWVASLYANIGTDLGSAEAADDRELISRLDRIEGTHQRILEILESAPRNPGGMMRTKTALQRADGSGWHYGIAGKSGGHPLGRCADHPPHPTEDEARECYGAYVREDTIKLDAGTIEWTSCKARPDGERCPNPTRSFATYGDDGYGMTPLCPDHMTAEDVIAAAQLDGPAGDAWIF